VVPFAPGGGNDAFARLLGQKLGESWKQAVVIDNRAGAGGNIGTEFVSKAPADGYTLLLGHTGTLSINPALYTRLAGEAQKNLVPVASIATAPLVLVVSTSMPITSVKQLIDLAKAKPGELNYASSGSGTGSHLSGELLQMMADIKLSHIAYKGTSPAITDVLAGHVNMMFSVIPTALPHIRAGKLRALAVTSAQPMSMLPNVPTVAAAGLPGFESSLSYGILAPRGTPEALLTAMHDEVGRILVLPDVQERLALEGASPLLSSRAEYAALIRQESEKWAKVIKASGATAD
jgi:tripartite-type tricarboxylate transporter receptor subunit TctC